MDLYVASFGSDETGDGSFMNPYRTIPRALESAMDSDDVIIINPSDITNMKMEEVDIKVDPDIKEAILNLSEQELNAILRRALFSKSEDIMPKYRYIEF